MIVSYSGLEIFTFIRRGLRVARRRRELLTARKHAPTSTTSRRSLYIKVTYGSSCNVKAIKRFVNRRHLVNSIAHVGVSFGVQRNMFRQLYRLNWPSSWPQE